MTGKAIGCALICACLYFVTLVLSEQQVQFVGALERNTETGHFHSNIVKDLFHYLNASKVGSSLVAQLSDCAFACLRVVTCFSFNVAAYPDIDGNLWCELLATDKYNASDKFHANPHFHHYGIDTPCSKRPCKNGGKCIALYEHNDFKCACPSGYKGKKCEKDIDECKENTDNCSTNAQCHNTPGSFNCTCNSGFKGDGVNCSIVSALCQPIGVQDVNKIPDSSMNASSYYNANYYPHYGRLHGTRGYGWEPKTKYDRTDYLQVDLGALHSVCALATQGRRISAEWTTQYKVSLSPDGVSWSFYQENNTVKEFPGNSDTSTVVENRLGNDTMARYVRFYALAYYRWPCIRVEIFVMN